MKLIKLMYLADREALAKWSSPISGDRYVAMNYGPGLSEMYAHITQSDPPGVRRYWDDYISEPENFQVSSKKDPGVGRLSRRELELVDAIYEKYGGMDQWQLSDLTHELPEWKHPDGSMIPISHEDLLSVLGKSDREIHEIRDDWETHAEIDELLNES